ncbi:MAG: anthranilate synthase component I [Deltaproteobacteria bacterium]|uniref:Anthranilate synthase component 1 n=1 Tax=Candidatus Zymogenus saltonus TaxID=2844893 RepID=A0A9D8KHX4_9DELT|nr:anthranilate synthase component I [Candidatus Zymogenus saltonus]
MITPTFQEFERLSMEGNLIPVYQEILADLETPVSAFKKLNGASPSFLLESVEGGEKWGRYSFLGIGPAMIFRSKGNMIEVLKNGELLYTTKEDDPLSKLKEIMDRYRPVVDVPGLPRFYGGAVGYLSYDMVRFMENIPNSKPDDLKTYDSYFIIPCNVVVFDNARNTMKLVANVFLDSSSPPEDSYVEATSTINRMIHKLGQPLNLTKLKSDDGVPLFVDSNFNERDFTEAVDKCREYIINGDIIQVVLSQRFEMEIDVEPFELYRALRIINPSPYMFYLQFEELTLVGSSPEVLVRKEGERVEVRPIAGTRPRGKSADEDERLMEDLLSDPKELAEHVMLVDLGRNDLGRIAQFGSVNVANLMRIEKYSHVMHIVSDVEGRLKNGHNSFDVLRAAFPAGTLTGAPKVRAMEIIEEIEPVRRGTYGGAVGYFSFSGNMDMCITIRTMLVMNGKIYLQAGAGIVYDSDPKMEYKETQHKAKGMLKAVEMARKNMKLR